MTNSLALPATLVLLLAAACGGPRSEAAPAMTGSVEETVFDPAVGVDLSTMTRTASGLYFKDLIVGGGAEVVAGKPTSVRYAGWLPEGTHVDATGPTGPLFTFSPGRGEVIAGWDEGVLGMREGGRRQLVIPPALGYGASGSGPVPPNAVLVFVVDVVETR
jgi:peptidylprolyl isomerase